MMQMQRTIKYDADRVKGFGREVMSVPGCEQLEGCSRCGCSPWLWIGPGLDSGEVMTLV
jgi:hypothetical protein